MGKIKYSLLLITSLVFGLISAINFAKELDKSANPYHSNLTNNSLVPPNATISGGGVTVCQNEEPVPQIIFTGSSGVQPYTFSYRINTGPIQTITTEGTDNSVTINADISTVGTLNYTLLSVEDDSEDITPINESVQIIVIQSPDATLGGTGSGTTFNGLPVFRQCINSGSQFTFTNLSTTSALNTSYTINWGDGSPDFNATTWSSITHSFNVGIYSLTYTITGSNGCDTVAEYTVFVGSNPAVSLGNPGNTDICNVNPLTFPITGTENNPPGTIYTVTFNDGSPPEVFNHPPPASVSHTFSMSSCNTTSSDGTNTYENSFSAIIVASNPCSTSSVGVVPIYVSIAPEASFSSEDNTCVNTPICFQNTSIGDENNGLGNSCDTSPNIIWEVTPATGFTVSSGSLGNDFGSNDPSVWLAGSDNICLNFTQVGSFQVRLRTGNRCGMDDVVRTICVEDDLVPVFATNLVEGCEVLQISTSNTTDESNSCETPTYLWEVNYTAEFCGTNSEWSFINGTDENSASPSFQFDTAGTYELVMTATNSCGDFETSQLIEVKQPPEVTISTVMDACGTASISPVATVETCTDSSDNITYSWSFPGGSPSTSNQLNPGVIDYNATGDYTIELSVINSCGTTTVTEDFSVNDSPTITNTDVSQSICSGASTTEITLTSDNTSTTYNWVSNNPAGLTGFISNGNSNTIPQQFIVNSTTAPVVLEYTVTPEINGCTGEAVVFQITVIPAPLITLQPQSDAVCQNGIVNDLSVAFEGSGTPVYQWYQNTSNNTATGTAIAGATSDTYTPSSTTVGTLYYYVIISFSTGGCSEVVSDIAEIEVTNLTQIDTQPQNTQSICVGGISETLQIVVSGGSQAPTFQWFSNTTNSNTGGTPIPGETSATYTPPVFNTTGTFYFYVEANYSENGCANLTSTVSEIVVVDDPEITSQPLSTQNLCQNTIAQDLEVMVSDGLGTSSYQWYVNSINNTTSGSPISGATANVFTPLTNTVGTFYYYCIVTQDVSGCEVTSASATVEVSEGAQFTLQPVLDELCLGETTADLTVSYTNGAGIATYQWYQNGEDNPLTGTAIAGATSSTYSPDVSSIGSTYYYVIINFSSGGCSEIVSETAEIIVNETPFINDSTALICSGNSFEFTPNTTNTGDIIPLNTLYTWTMPTVSPAGSIIGATEQSTGISTISQTLENTTTNPSTVTYTVTPVSGNCIGETFDVVVTVNPSISISSTVIQNLCYQANTASIEIDIAGGIPFATGNPYSISWTGPGGFVSSNEDIYNLAIGTYSLNIEDDGGCPFTETFQITEPDQLVFSGVNFDPETISCYNANDGEISIDVSGGVLPYAYAWTLNTAPFSSEEDLINLGPGDYVITVTDANNCSPIILNFIIEEPDELEVILNTKTDVLCFGDATGNISVDVIGGRVDYTFAWTGPNGFTSANEDIDNLAAGIYNLTVTDNSGCTDTLEVEILQNTEIQIDLTVSQMLCYGDNDASIVINSISGGISPYEVAWSNLGLGMSQYNLSGGTYTITITDAENCEKEFPVIIDQPPVFDINPVVTQMTCAGENDASIVLNFVGGIDPVSLVWDDDPVAGTERNNLAPGIYTVTIIDGTPCEIQESFTVFNIEPLSLSANVTHALDCNDTNSGGINLLIEGGTPPFDVLWSNNETTEDLNNVPPNTYVATVTDANGCSIEGSWDVNRFEPLIVEVIDQVDVDCETASVDQTFLAIASGGVPPFQFNWSDGTVSGPNNEFMSTTTNGLVVLEVIDSLGCSANYTFNVEIAILGQPGFTTSSFGYLNYGVYAIQDPIDFTNTATGNYETVLWDFGDGSFSSEENPVHTYYTPGSYVVTQTVTYAFGCVFENVLTLIIEEGYKLVMPDAFTPNEDGINDFFAPVFIGLSNLDLSVYDTWGSLIYNETGDSIRGWDGKVKEEAAENGNYYYTFSAKTFYGNEVKKQGAFVFIK
ncbi:gliding motility-associated C-terminal domain-containing protein [Winogradskyella litoriviva]|uniref:Gliding motility-associated C-terminal domain-containing protein n=1 Tax=Winogradskyella litoriviva TaxID=1220182 RepID=A0ABX2E6K4_9FLAO|nr:PKD domain-containing protein [Winogradskyella litoriviva]NRD24080.1 gliding motility-associated C-terminal domain-containing protein [Winogradskyella litoriviva]